MLLQLRGLVRRMLRGARTVRGAIFFILGLLIFAAWLMPAFFQANLGRVDPAEVRRTMPLILLAVSVLSALTSAGEKAIAFTPAEVDFLFPAPFPRRHLLLYKLGKSAFGAVISSLILSVALLRFSPMWLGCLLGSFL